jgi:glycosyltransferase involved in cell wall biosynthesis
MKRETSVRLFVDGHVFDGEFQGSRTFIRELYGYLSQKKDILLFVGANNLDNLKKNFPQTNNITFIKYKSRSSVSRLIFEIPSLIKKYKIEYAHFQYFVPLMKNCKYIVTTHDVLFREFPSEFPTFYRIIKNELYKLSVRKADIVTTVSEHSKISIEKFLGLKPALIHVIPNAVSAKFFDPYDKLEARAAIKKKYGFEKFVLYVSRIEPRKNHLLLLKAYLELELFAQGYHLVLLGEKSIRVPEFDEMIKQLPDSTKPFVLISASIEDEELMEFYRAATIFVYPSKAEGFGIPPLEAASLKIPVICSNASAMSDFQFFGKTHIDPLDYSLLKSSLSQLIRMPPEKAYLSHLSEIIKERYSWAKSGELLYNLIMAM